VRVPDSRELHWSGLNSGVVENALLACNSLMLGGAHTYIYTLKFFSEYSGQPIF
jgi:hypothetical protein